MLMQKTSTMSGSPFLGLAAHLLLVCLLLITIGNIEARRRPHRDRDSARYTSEESDCDSDLRIPNTDHSDSRRWRSRRPPPTSSPRIINGRLVKLGEYPFVVRVETTFRDGRINICSGSIVDSKLVLTAAHCLLDDGFNVTLTDPATIRVVAGDYRRDFDPDRAVYYKPQLIAVHKQYQQSANFAVEDFGIIVTRDYIRIDKGDSYGYGKVDTIDLPPRNGLDAVKNSNFTVVGWGWTRPGDTTSEAAQLMAYDTKIEPCSDPRVPYVINKDSVCISNANMHGVCRGDSGGPLFLQPPPGKDGRPRKPVLYGITSFIPGAQCGQAQSYFLNVGLYTQWLNGVMISPTLSTNVIIRQNTEP